MVQSAQAINYQTIIGSGAADSAANFYSMVSNYVTLSQAEFADIYVPQYSAIDEAALVGSLMVQYSNDITAGSYIQAQTDLVQLAAALFANTGFREIQVTVPTWDSPLVVGQKFYLNSGGNFDQNVLSSVVAQFSKLHQVMAASSSSSGSNSNPPSNLDALSDKAQNYINDLVIAAAGSVFTALLAFIGKCIIGTCPAVSSMMTGLTKDVYEFIVGLNWSDIQSAVRSISSSFRNGSKLIRQSMSKILNIDQPADLEAIFLSNISDELLPDFVAQSVAIMQSVQALNPGATAENIGSLLGVMYNNGTYTTILEDDDDLAGIVQDISQGLSSAGTQVPPPMGNMSGGSTVVLTPAQLSEVDAASNQNDMLQAIAEKRWTEAEFNTNMIDPLTQELEDIRNAIARTENIGTDEAKADLEILNQRALSVDGQLKDAQGIVADMPDVFIPG